RDFFKRDDKEYDLVIHLAAIVGGRESIEGRPMAVADNFSIDSEFFQWCLKTKPKKIVYFSSSAAYPTHYQQGSEAKRLQEWMITPSAPHSPDMTYGMAKVIGEYLASFVENVHIFRPFSGYAYDQDLNYPFPMYIKRALEKSDPFEVWGPGTQTRDFIHMTDVVNAVMTAVEQGITGPINLGTGRSTSFMELAQMSMDAVGYKGEILTRPDKPVGCMHRVSDNTKLLSFYTPKITLEAGIIEAVSALG
ncbi:MAG: NAD-dependent epimerase/dehydratase family protein, partial [Micrococcales bacterium]|nr:NAD-dependent epimerase/dehydratase family protein [Micrococcales bacterium]